MVLFPCLTGRGANGAVTSVFLQVSCVVALFGAGSFEVGAEAIQWQNLLGHRDSSLMADICTLWAGFGLKCVEIGTAMRLPTLILQPAEGTGSLPGRQSLTRSCDS